MEKFNTFIQKAKIFFLRFHLIIKILVMILFVWLVVKQVNLREILKALNNVNYLLVVPVILYIPSLILSTIKWNSIIKYSFWKLFRIYWISNFFSNFLPSTIGGDTYKVVRLGSELGKKNIFTSVLIDRLTGIMGTLVLLAVLSYKILPFFHLDVEKNLAIFLFIVISVVVLAISFFSDKLKKSFVRITSHIKEMNLNWSKIVFISLIYPLLGSLSLWVYLLMFGYNTDYLLITGFYLTIQLISILPISINAIGVYELSLISLLSLIGVPAEISLSISLLSRIVMLIQTSIGGIFYLFDKKEKLV